MIGLKLIYILIFVVRGEVRKLDRPNQVNLPTIVGGRDGCQGDSGKIGSLHLEILLACSLLLGGPLWRLNKAGVAVQLGIISRGQKCARINRPGIYTRFCIRVATKIL